MTHKMEWITIGVMALFVNPSMAQTSSRPVSQDGVIHLWDCFAPARTFVSGNDTIHDPAFILSVSVKINNRGSNKTSIRKTDKNGKLLTPVVSVEPVSTGTLSVISEYRGENGFGPVRLQIYNRPGTAGYGYDAYFEEARLVERPPVRLDCRQLR